MQVNAELSKIDPYFTKLAEGMKVWIAAWDSVNANEVAQGEENGEK